jgi:hypothetical protein
MGFQILQPNVDEVSVTTIFVPSLNILHSQYLHYVSFISDQNIDALEHIKQLREDLAFKRQKAGRVLSAK